MYYPYMRGKQFELAALREVAPRLYAGKIHPIIEPVKANLAQLCSSIKALNDQGIIPHIVVNPEVGELANDCPDSLFNLISNENVSFIPCIRLYSQNISHTQTLLNQLLNDESYFSLYLQEDIGNSFNSYLSKAVANIILNRERYSQSFLNSLPRCVIITSAFPAESRNADYNTTPRFFTDAHLTYTNPLVQQQIGFGDYLTINDTWSTSGGPAFVIAIHITYIDSRDSNMYVKHSLSTSSPNDQSDPAGKFQEALKNMITFANQEPSLDQNTLGFQEYINIHNRGSYHGLGVPKKLSMMHHLETINNFL